MPSLIETLIGGGIARPDEKRLVPTRRPMPIRPRDLLELFGSMGAEMSLTTLFQATQLYAAEPRTMAFIALNRWPTEAELDRLPKPYNAQFHLRALLTGAEFRASIVRRICDAYAERPRLLFVRIPRCAGEHFLMMANHMHPVIPNDLAAKRRDGKPGFLPTLGAYLGRFAQTKTIMMTQPTLAPFVEAQRPPAHEERAEAGLQWNLNPPARRSGDRLFTILREPSSLILSQVNATLDALLKSPGSDSPATAAWRTQLPQIPATADQAGLKHTARRILRLLKLRNPICHALADGTADAAFRAVRLQDVELADISHYPDWTKYTWDVEPEPPSNTSTPHLTLADLSPPEREHLGSLIAEDLRFYAPVRTALDKLEGFKNAVRGRDL